MINKNEVVGLCNSVIMVADKFIGKVEQGKARSVETLNDLIKLKSEAMMIKSRLTSNE